MKGKKLNPMNSWESYSEEFPEGWIRTTLWMNIRVIGERYWRADYFLGDSYMTVEVDANKNDRHEAIKQLRAKL